MGRRSSQSSGDDRGLDTYCSGVLVRNNSFILSSEIISASPVVESTHFHMCSYVVSDLVK